MKKLKSLLESLGLKVGKVKTVLIDRIVSTTTVREKLNERRVDLFVLQLHEGVELDPLLLHHDNQLIDGRTRLAAYERLNKKNVN